MEQFSCTAEFMLLVRSAGSEQGLALQQSPWHPGQCAAQAKSMGCKQTVTCSINSAVGHQNKKGKECDQSRAGRRVVLEGGNRHHGNFSSDALLQT